MRDVIFNKILAKFSCYGIYWAITDGFQCYICSHDPFQPSHIFVNTSRTSCTPSCKMYEVLYRAEWLEFSFQSTSVLHRTLLMNNPAAVVFSTVTASLFARDLLPLRSRLNSTLSLLFLALCCRLRQITIQCLISCLSVGENRRKLWNLQRAKNLNLGMRAQLEKCYFIKNCCNTKKGG